METHPRLTAADLREIEIAAKRSRAIEDLEIRIDCLAARNRHTQEALVCFLVLEVVCLFLATPWVKLIAGAWYELVSQMLAIGAGGGLVIIASVALVVETLERRALCSRLSALRGNTGSTSDARA